MHNHAQNWRAQPLRQPPVGPDGYARGALIDGKYRLRRRAGQGGMGSVWIATNVALDSEVAIKLIQPELGSIGHAHRLLSEARAAAMLSHPAIVRVFDFGVTNHGDPYIVMEALGGEPLGDLLAREGPLPPERAVAIFLPLVSGVHAAHQRGIVHRDLKPDNIVLTELPDGHLQPKIVDFGIAKTLWIDGTINGSTIVGTPGYMPPEQAMGLSVDRRADVWSCCASLFHAIAGVPPVRGRNEVDALRAVVQDDIRSLAEVAAIDGELADIIDRGLAKHPDDRWPGMQELGDALTAWLVSRGYDEDITGRSLRASWPKGGGERFAFATLPIPLVHRTPANGTSNLPEEEDELDAATLSVAPTTRRRRWPGAIALVIIAAATVASGAVARKTAERHAAALPPWLAAAAVIAPAPADATAH